MTYDELMLLVVKQQKLTNKVVTCYEAGAFLRREVGDWSRFNNRRQVSSYTGLCPQEHSSGGKRRAGGVSKSGNPRVRAMLVEMVWRMMRWQPGYTAVQKWARVLNSSTPKPAARKKAVVAIARQLAVDL